jgi:cell wall-associated NlpC family hydrolase
VTALRPFSAPRTSRRARRLVVSGLTALALSASLAATTPAQAAPAATTAQNPSPATSADAKAIAYARTHPLLHYGSKGSAVRRLQRYVGVYASGRFGAATRHQVRNVQKWGHLRASGVVNLDTWHVAYRYAVHRSKERAARLSPAHIIKTAKRYDGGPYRSGGTTPSGFDCSGYTRYVFGKLGVSLPHNSGQQYGVVKHISRKYARAGDLIFFHHGSHIYHVGIYAGHGGLYHASHPGRRTGYETLWTSAVWFGRVR